MSVPGQRRGSGPGEDRNRTYGTGAQRADRRARKQQSKQRHPKFWSRIFTAFTIFLIVAAVAALYFRPDLAGQEPAPTPTAPTDTASPTPTS